MFVSIGEMPVGDIGISFFVSTAFVVSIPAYFFAVKFDIFNSIPEICICNVVIYFILGLLIDQIINKVISKKNSVTQV
jgi:hypothetical protein